MIWFSVSLLNAHFPVIMDKSLNYNPNNSLTSFSFSNNKHPPSCPPSNILLSLSFLNNGDFKASLKLHSFKFTSDYGENGHGSAPPLAFTWKNPLPAANTHLHIFHHLGKIKTQYSQTFFLILHFFYESSINYDVSTNCNIKKATTFLLNSMT